MPIVFSSPFENSTLFTGASIHNFSQINRGSNSDAQWNIDTLNEFGLICMHKLVSFIVYGLNF